MSDISLPEPVVLHVMQSMPRVEMAMETLKVYSESRRLTAQRKQRIAQIKKEAEQQIKELMAEQLCIHPLTTEHGDPSGNGDSMTECLICGEWCR